MNSSEKNTQLQKPRNIEGGRSGIIERIYNADLQRIQMNTYMDRYDRQLIDRLKIDKQKNEQTDNDNTIYDAREVIKIERELGFIIY